MSQITIENFGKYEQVVMGWDPDFKGFFFYCLLSSLDDDPEVWEIRITDIHLFEITIEKAGIFLPTKIKKQLIEHSKQNSNDVLGYDLQEDRLD